MSDGRATYNFQDHIETMMSKRDITVEPNKLLEDLFRACLSQLLILKLKRGGRIESGALNEIKRNMISEFRQCKLSPYQKSVEQYETLFDETVREIFKEAEMRHQGVDTINVNQTLEVNERAYAATKGFSKSASGIYVPNSVD